MRRLLFRVTINNSDIMRFPLPKAPAVIKFSLEFEEHEARIFAGLSLMEYENLPGVMEWCDAEHPLSKAEVLVLYRLHNQIAQVSAHLSAPKKRSGR